MSDSSNDAPIRVLHIDDDPDISELLQSYLERFDDRISVASTTEPRAGIELLAEEPIDCVVSDYQMPVIDGLSVLERIREEFPNLPFILFTGHGSEQIASEAIEAGVSGYLQKDGPESYELLANRIRNLVGKRRSERRARVARERLVELYEQTDGFYVLDEDWTITYWNRRIAERTGREPDAVLGESFWDVFPEAAETELYERFNRAMETGEHVEFETEYEPHGYWVELRVYPVGSDLFVHSRDISAEMEREQTLQYRNELLESFASTVSHDLRNPLNVAEGNLRLAQETGDFDHLEEVAQAHNRMRNLIDELLHVARGDDVDRSEVSLRDSAETAWRTVTAGGATLTVESDASFRAYESQLRRLFENLLWNALDHGGATEIRVGALDGGFYVEDDGTGIPPEEREAVFDSGFSTDPESPGYGLSIVEGIAEMHGWRVAVEAGETGGARFEITGVEGL